MIKENPLEMWSIVGNGLLVGWSSLSITTPGLVVVPLIDNVASQQQMSTLFGPINELGTNTNINNNIHPDSHNQYDHQYIGYNPLTWKWKMDHVDEPNQQARKTQSSSYSSLSSTAVPRIYQIYQVMIINKCLIKSILSIYHRHCIEGHLLDPSPLSYMFLDSRWKISTVCFLYCCCLFVV